MGYALDMKTLTAEEASQDLVRWLQRAMGGEQIAIHEDGCAVLLQPLPATPDLSPSKPLSSREALRRLQSQATLSESEAQAYLDEVRAERSVQDRRNGQ